MAETTLSRSWSDCNALELMQRRHLRMGVSAVFIIGFFVSLTHALVSLFGFCSQLFFPRIHVALQEMQWRDQLRLSLPRRVLVKKFHTQH